MNPNKLPSHGEGMDTESSGFDTLEDVPFSPKTERTKTEKPVTRVNEKEAKDAVLHSLTAKEKIADRSDGSVVTMSPFERRRRFDRQTKFVEKDKESVMSNNKLGDYEKLTRAQDADAKLEQIADKKTTFTKSAESTFVYSNESALERTSNAAIATANQLEYILANLSPAEKEQTSFAKIRAKLEKYREAAKKTGKDGIGKIRDKIQKLAPRTVEEAELHTHTESEVNGQGTINAEFFKTQHDASKYDTVANTAIGDIKNISTTLLDRYSQARQLQDESKLKRKDILTGFLMDTVDKKYAYEEAKKRYNRLPPKERRDLKKRGEAPHETWQEEMLDFTHDASMLENKYSRGRRNNEAKIDELKNEHSFATQGANARAEQIKQMVATYMEAH